MLSCRRDDFSLPPGIHYLNCAYMAPLSKRVEEAGMRGLAAKKDPSKISPNDFFDASDGVRSEFAKLIGANDGSSVSLAPSVSYGTATAAKNLNIEPGKEILVLFEQFPSHVYTWRRLAQECGLKLKTIAPPPSGPGRGRAWNEGILESISTETAAVCLPTVHWTDGTRFDLAAVSKRAHEVGAALIVDGTQSIGAVPFDASEIKPDCVVCAGYKWLMGPYSVAMVYWSDRFKNGSPLEENWIARKDSENFAGLVDYRDEYQAGAIRYDVGERSNFILMPMMLEALRYVQELGPERIQEYCRNLTDGVFQSVVELGFQIEDSLFRSPHLFGLRVPTHVSLETARRALAERNVFVSVRGTAIRVAPNVYNDANDVDRLLDALRACCNDPVR